MFTPEFSSEDEGEFVLVANHALHDAAAVAMSIAYNAARIAYGRTQLPASLQRCRLIHDVRGQHLAADVPDRVRAAFQGVCEVEFKV